MSEKHTYRQPAGDTPEAALTKDGCERGVSEEERLNIIAAIAQAGIEFSQSEKVITESKEHNEL
jgi:hypothetical protein